MANSSSDRYKQEKLYESWMNNQQEELKELQNFIIRARNSSTNDVELHELLQKIMGNFQGHIYALSGIEIESRIAEYLQGIKIGDFGQLSAKQITMIDKLQRQIIIEENKLSSRLASLQEDVVDQPIAMAAKICDRIEQGESEKEPLNKLGEDMANLLEEADELRMKSLKEILGILTPIQGVEYLAAAKRIRLCLQQWGKKREQEHNSNSN
ncbi:putative LRR receptor-like serine/threonine-protein kinase-like [Capsicum annuum]|nr:putative LRR receptor-like serine/threonine-protein kinase-like [Capsicum annuum]